MSQLPLLLRFRVTFAQGCENGFNQQTCAGFISGAGPPVSLAHGRLLQQQLSGHRFSQLVLFIKSPGGLQLLVLQ